MFQHLFKLIWNRKRKNTLLIIEIFLSFMVFFAVLSFAIYNINNYRKPLGFEFQNVWALNINWGQTPKEQAWEKMRQIQQQIEQYNQIERHSLTHESYPFSFSQSNTSLVYEGRTGNSNYYETDANYAETLNIPLLEGSWYSHEDTVQHIPSIVINKQMRDELFEEDEKAVGKVVLFSGHRERRVTGVIDQFRRDSEFTLPRPAMFLQFTSEDYAPPAIMLKVNEQADVAFEERFLKSLASIAPELSFELEYLDDKRKVANRFVTIPLFVMTVMCAFLLINVGLGMFGVLWYNINQRKAEIGLRQALGATGASINRQFVMEMWILASLGVVVGLVFAFQFPLLKVFDVKGEIYLSAILASSGLIFLLTSFCAYLPSRQASEIQPAIALHEE